MTVTEACVFLSCSVTSPTSHGTLRILNISLYDRKHGTAHESEKWEASFPRLNVSVDIRHARITQTTEGTRHVRLTHMPHVDVNIVSSWAMELLAET